MCGIAGIVRSDAREPVQEQTLLRMARAIRHRGPDGFGLCLDPGAGLVSAAWRCRSRARLAALARRERRSVLVYNGEKTTTPSCVDRWRRRERRVRRSDTEVVHRLLERHDRRRCIVSRAVAFAWWRRSPPLTPPRPLRRPADLLRLGRDERSRSRRGKGCSPGEVSASPDMLGLDQVFTLWAPQARGPR